MPHSYGYRARSRHTFAVPFREHGTIPTSKYLVTYKIGDIVDIKGTGKVHKGMPHRYYHGKTGVVWNVTPRAVGVEVNKRVNTRIIKKRIHVRIEHVSKSRCRDEFIERRRLNDQRRREAAKNEEKVILKRIPEGPQPAKSFPIQGTEVVDFKYQPYEEIY